MESEAEFVSQPVIAEESRFHDGMLYGRASGGVTGWRCLQATRGHFGYALAEAFVARFMASGTLERATRMTDEVRAAMHTNIESAPFLDDATRAQALRKLDAMATKVGHPSTWPIYAGVTFGPGGGSYLENELALRRAHDVFVVESLQQPVDRTAFAFSPDTTNAAYSWTRNDITIPSAILRLPFFSSARPDTLNFGSLGSIIGHEITHGFDDQGRHYDARGKLADWWTDTVAAEFRKRAQCMVDQFSAYKPLPGATIAR